MAASYGQQPTVKRSTALPATARTTRPREERQKTSRNIDRLPVDSMLRLLPHFRVQTPRLIAARSGHRSFIGVRVSALPDTDQRYVPKGPDASQSEPPMWWLP